MDGACWVCFCCQHSSITDTNVRIFWVRMMECMCAQTRPQFTLSSERVLGEWGQNPCELRRNPPPPTRGSEEGWTHNTASRRTASPTHYRLNYSGPTVQWLNTHTFAQISLITLSPIAAGGWEQRRRITIPLACESDSNSHTGHTWQTIFTSSILQHVTALYA